MRIVLLGLAWEGLPSPPPFILPAARVCRFTASGRDGATGSPDRLLPQATKEAAEKAASELRETTARLESMAQDAALEAAAKLEAAQAKAATELSRQEVSGGRGGSPGKETARVPNAHAAGMTRKGRVGTLGGSRFPLAGGA